MIGEHAGDSKQSRDTVVSQRCLITKANDGLFTNRQFTLRISCSLRNLRSDFRVRSVLEAESSLYHIFYNANQTLSDWGTANNAILPSATAVAKASADAITAAAPAAAPAPPAAAPEPSPSPGTASFQDAQDSPIGKIVGLIFAVVGPSVATILWLSITFSYRQEKAVIINGVQQQIATSDITGNSAALIGSTQGASHPQERKQSAKPTYTLPVDTAFDLHGLSPIGPEDTTQQLSNRSASGTSPNVDRAASMGSSASRSPSEMQGVSLLRQLRGAAATDKDATTEVDPFLLHARGVAREIAARCLRRWDGFLAVRAAQDSLGRPAGVWKDKFEAVRSAVMLLAFRNVNAMLQKQTQLAAPGAPEPPGSLMAAWQVSSWRDRNEIVTLITKSLQDITEEEAQTQPFKDAEPPGWHDRLSVTVELCTSRMSFKRQISS
ncbi:hypothetical protein ABBQ38_015434 [Trebouxia sp. C0009 RCD-2024]